MGAHSADRSPARRRLSAESSSATVPDTTGHRCSMALASRLRLRSATGSPDSLVRSSPSSDPSSMTWPRRPSRGGGGRVVGGAGAGGGGGGAPGGRPREQPGRGGGRVDVGALHLHPRGGGRPGRDRRHVLLTGARPGLDGGGLLEPFH